MKIINLIHIGNQVVDMDNLPKNEKEKIWKQLNRQALEAVGYKEVKASA